MDTYVRALIEVRARGGARLWYSEGREYLDFFAGLSVHNAGHCHPRIVSDRRRPPALPAARTSSTRRRRCASERLASRASAAGCSGATRARRRASARSSWARTCSRPRGRLSPDATLDGALHGRTLGRSRRPRSSPARTSRAPAARGRGCPWRRPRSLGEASAPARAVIPSRSRARRGRSRSPTRVLVAAREACDEAGAALWPRRGRVWDGEDGTLVGPRAAAGVARRPDDGGGRRSAGPAGGGVAHASTALAEVLTRGDDGSTFAGVLITAAAPCWRRSSASTTRELLADVVALGERLRNRASRPDSTGSTQVCGRGLMVGVTPADGLARGWRSPPTPPLRAGAQRARPGGCCGCCRR